MVAVGLAMVLVCVLHTPAVTAQESVMDKDGDGVVTPQEFLDHAQAQEACAGGACGADDAHAHATLRAASEEEEPAGMPTAEDIAAAKADVAAQLKTGKAVKMTGGNSAGVLDGTNNILIKFSTSWCGHCVKMEPDWQRLAKLVHTEYKGCTVVSVDCEASAEMCQAFGVQGYPTIMLLVATATETGEIGYQPVPYQGQRDFGAMLGFIKQNKAAKPKNWVWATVKGLLGQLAGFFQIQVQMPK